MASVRVEIDEEDVLDDMSIEEIHEYLARRRKQGETQWAVCDVDSLQMQVETLIDDFQRGLPISPRLSTIARNYYNRIIVPARQLQ